MKCLFCFVEKENESMQQAELYISKSRKLFNKICKDCLKYFTSKIDMCKIAKKCIFCVNDTIEKTMLSTKNDIIEFRCCKYCMETVYKKLNINVVQEFVEIVE